MVSYEEAKAVALKQANKILNLTNERDEVILCESHTVERPEGWVFYYDSRGFLETGDVNSMLMGNAPIFVDRQNGEANVINGALPVDQALERLHRRRAP